MGVTGLFDEMSPSGGELASALEMVHAVGAQNKVASPPGPRPSIAHELVQALANEMRAAAQLQAEADQLAAAAMSQNALLKERISELEAQVQPQLPVFHVHLPHVLLDGCPAFSLCSLLDCINLLSQP